MIVRPIVAVLATALLSGCGGARHTAPPVKAHEATKPAAITTAISRGTPAQRRLLHSIVARMTPTTIYGVSIRPAGPHWFGQTPHSVIVRIAYRPYRQRGLGEWEAALLGQAFATKSRRLGLAPVAAYQSPTGAVALGGPKPPKQDARKPISGREVAERVRSAAESSGAEVIGLRTIEPLNIAFMVTLRVNRPASYLAHRFDPFLSSLPSATDERLDGGYVRVVDRSGRFVALQAAFSGAGIGGSSSAVRPDLRGCYSIPRFSIGPNEAEPPPCPAD